MDTLSHGLWGGVAFGRKNKWQFIAVRARSIGRDIFAVIAGFIIYFIWRRIKDKKKETFEDRDN